MDAPRAGATYVIRQADAEGYAVDAGGRATADGTPITSWPYSGAVNQQWKLVPSSSSPEWYKLVSTNRAKCADVSGTSTAAGASIVLYRCDGITREDPSQLWQPRRTSDVASPEAALEGAWQLANKNSGMVLTRSAPPAGSQFIQTTQKGTDAQLFHFLTP